MEVPKIFFFALFELVYYLNTVKCTQDMENWKVHQKRITNFPCSAPQPRALRFKEIIAENDLPDLEAQVFPEMTVLHRCDSQTGCCKGTKVCAPLVTEDVHLTFRIIRNVRVHKRSAQSRGSRDKYIRIVASNHTFCSCQSEFDLPK